MSKFTQIIFLYAILEKEGRKKICLWNNFIGVLFFVNFFIIITKAAFWLVNESMLTFVSSPALLVSLFLSLLRRRSRRVECLLSKERFFSFFPFFQSYIVPRLFKCCDILIFLFIVLKIFRFYIVTLLL